MGRTRVRLVTYAWGKAYVDKLLDYTLASVNSPRNLPALAKEFDCEVVVLTEEALFAHVRQHPLTRRLETVAPLRLVALDDLIREPWQYGMTLAQALHRGMADLGEAMTETYFLFLNGDFVLADGSYERLIPHMRAGERALLSPSYCVNGEAVAALLDAGRSESGAISLPPRAMARMILDNRHNTVRAKTVSQQIVHFRYMDQFYWQVDTDTLLGFQMPVSLVAMRPEVALSEIASFWDWGVVYDFCPSKTLTVLGDSDEFLMLELRGQAEHADSVLLGWSPPAAIAARMRGYITQYQVDNAKLPLTLHAADIPPQAAAARKSLEEFRDTVLRCLPSAPIDHRDHSQWRFHTHHFAEFAKDPVLSRRIAQLKKEIAQARADRRAERARIQGDFIARLSALEDALKDAIRARAQAAGGGEVSPEAADGGFGNRLFRTLFGRIPQARLWHPWFLPYRDVSAMLRAVPADRKALFACDPSGPLHRAAKALPPHCRTIAPRHLLQDRAPVDIGMYDECILDFLVGNLIDAALIMDRALAHVKPGGRLTIHVANLVGDAPEEWTAVFASRFVGSPLDIRISSTGSWAGASAIRTLGWALAALFHRWAGWPVILAASIAVSALLALLAYLVEMFSPRLAGTTRIGRYCTSVTIVAYLTPAATTGTAAGTRAAVAQTIVG